jgi:hypothetical protein
MLKVVDSIPIRQVCGFNDFIDTVKNLVTCFLVEGSLMVEVEEIMDAGEESLCIEA